MTYDSSSAWQIDHQCPQCGAFVTLNETDRLLLCSFCRTKLHLVTNDYFRYCIPAKDVPSHEIIYIPYWRLRGLSFSVLAGGMTNRFFDANLLALTMSGMPYSLGLRPQAMKLTFVSPALEGRFLEPNLEAGVVMQSLGTGSPSCFYQAFIGEMISLIYSPMYVEGHTLYDAVLKRPVCSMESLGLDLLPAKSGSQNWQIRFIPTLCPGCGWDLQGEKDALVLTCANCDSAWTCRKNAFEKVAFSIVTDVEPAAYHLPFWRMRPRIEGVALESYADLIRLGNLPKVITAALEETPLYFWSPAFKVNPALFLRWSRQMTVSQPLGASSETLPRSALCPVTLPSCEAQESIIITIANLINDKRRLFPSLSDIRITPGETILEYHPFVIRRNELIHSKLKLTMDKNALTFGTSL
jgi:predicted RNA-binding Zn-ribbon protein involved in translation (DUF1610 family)